MILRGESKRIVENLIRLGYAKTPSEAVNKAVLALGKEHGILIKQITIPVALKKVESMSWSQLTEPLVKAKKKIKEEDVVALVHKIRKEKN